MECGANFAGERQPVCAGQHQVHHDDVGQRPVHGAAHLLAVTGEVDDEPDVRQVLGQQVAQLRVVIHDQHAVGLGHAASVNGWPAGRPGGCTLMQPDTNRYTGVVARIQRRRTMYPKTTGLVPMKASIPLVLLLALSAAPSAWGEEPPAQDVAPPSPAASSPTGEELPYGAGYEARQRQAAERERSQKAAASSGQLQSSGQRRPRAKSRRGPRARDRKDPYHVQPRGRVIPGPSDRREDNDSPQTHRWHQRGACPGIRPDLRPDRPARPAERDLREVRSSSRSSCSGSSSSARQTVP